VLFCGAAEDSEFGFAAEPTGVPGFADVVLPLSARAALGLGFISLFLRQMQPPGWVLDGVIFSGASDADGDISYRCTAGEVAPILVCRLPVDGGSGGRALHQEHLVGYGCGARTGVLADLELYQSQPARSQQEIPRAEGKLPADVGHEVEGAAQIRTRHIALTDCCE